MQSMPAQEMDVGDHIAENPVTAKGKAQAKTQAKAQAKGQAKVQAKAGAMRRFLRYQSEG